MNSLKKYFNAFFFVIFVSVICVFTLNIAFAQPSKINESNLLNISNRNKPMNNKYTGTPFVYIGETVGAKPKDKLSGWMDEEKKRLFGTTQITDNNFNPFETNTPVQPIVPVANTSSSLLKEIEYTNPFGKKQNNIYTTHTTDFYTFIQVTSPKELMVEEYISFINTQNIPFERTLLTTKNITDLSESFTLLNAQIDGQTVTPKIQHENKEIKLSFDGYLIAGSHRITLKYLIKDGITVNKDKAFIHYNVTGTKWAMPINKTGIYLAFPNKTTLLDKDLLFGTNYVSLKKAYEVKTNPSGNTVFVLNNPLPAYANIGLYAMFDSNIFPPLTLEDKLEKHWHTLTMLCAILFMIVYFALCALFLAFYKEKNIQKYIYHFAPLTLNRLYWITPTPYVLNQFKELYQTNKKTPLECRLNETRFYRSLGGKYICTIYRYIRLSIQYWLTSALICLGVVYFAQDNNIMLSSAKIGILICCYVLFNIIFWHFIGRKYILKEVKRFKLFLLDKNRFYGLTQQAGYALYMKNKPYALALNFDKEWTTHFEQNCLNKKSN